MTIRQLKIFGLILALTIFTSLTFGLMKKSPDKPRLVFNNKIIILEVADTPEKIAQGLSDRQSLPANQAMLFIFDKPGLYPFWMNRMRFNLDFIFIKNDKVVDLVEAVPFPKPGEEPQTIRAKSDFDRVLEVNEGMIKKLGLKIGNQVKLFR